MTACRFRRVFAAEKSALAAEWNQSFASLRPAASSFAPRRPQQAITGQVWQKYTLNISRLFNVLERRWMPPQI
jgi:hypothetical protein